MLIRSILNTKHKFKILCKNNEKREEAVLLLYLLCSAACMKYIYGIFILYFDYESISRRAEKLKK